MLIFNEIHKGTKSSCIYTSLNWRALSEMESYREPGMFSSFLDFVVSPTSVAQVHLLIPWIHMAQSGSPDIKEKTFQLCFPFENPHITQTSRQEIRIAQVFVPGWATGQQMNKISQLEISLIPLAQDNGLFKNQNCVLKFIKCFSASTSIIFYFFIL